MASTVTPYTHLWKLLHTAGISLTAAQIKVALISSGYTFSGTHTVFDPGTDDANDPSFNEAASGSGYATGGVLLTGAVAYSDHIVYGNVRWSALTKTFRYGVFYFSGSVGGLTDPLIACALFDDTPADTTVTASDWAIVIDSVRGLFYDPAQL